MAARFCLHLQQNAVFGLAKNLTKFPIDDTI